MIYTLTLQPSLDYYMQIDQLTPGKIHRAVQTEIYPGGKGINVSLMLHRMKVENTAVFFTAGFTGEQLLQLLHQQGGIYYPIRLQQGMTRLNVKIEAKEETQLNAAASIFDERAIRSLADLIGQIREGDFFVLSGSLPPDFPRDCLKRMIDLLSDRGVHLVLDAQGDDLLGLLCYHPFLIKPNLEELSDLFHKKISSTEDVYFYAQQLQEMGAQNVLISLGEQGAFLLDEHQTCYQSKPPKGNVIHTVAAGDSMVAGFLCGFLNTTSYEQAFKMGLCAGSATAFSNWLGDAQTIDRLYNTQADWYQETKETI